MIITKYEKFVESVSSHNDLVALTNFIIDKMVDNIMANYNDSLNADDGKYNILNFIELTTIDYMAVYNSALSQNIKNAIKKQYIVIFAEEQIDDRLGSYYQPEDREDDYIYGGISIRIKLDTIDSKSIIEANNKAIWKKFLNNYSKYIIHELQHWYDDVRSNGKYGDNEVTMDDKEISKDEYLKLPYEISARFTDTLYKMKIKQFKSVESFISRFIKLFSGWNLLTEDQQKRIKKRLAIHYVNFH